MIKYKNNFELKYSHKIGSSINLVGYSNSLEHYKDWLMLYLGTIEEERAIQSYIEALYHVIKRKIEDAKIQKC